MNSIPPSPGRPSASTGRANRLRRGFTLVHLLAYCGIYTLVLGTVTLTFYSVAQVRERLNSAQARQDAWRRLSIQFRRDCHAAAAAEWLVDDDASVARGPESSEAPSGESPARAANDRRDRPPSPTPTAPTAPWASTGRSPTGGAAPPRDPWAGSRLTLELPGAGRVHYILQTKRLLRREDAPDGLRVESFELGEDVAVRWSWHDPARRRLQLQMQSRDDPKSPARHGGHGDRSWTVIAGLRGEVLRGGATP